MKAFIGKLGLIALAACAPVALHAQAHSIAYGRTTLSFAPALGQTLAGAGITVTDLAQNPLPGGVATLTALQGVLDFKTALGDVEYSGGLQLSAAGQTVRFQDMALEISSPTAAALTAQVVYNGTVLGPRQAVFVINARPNYSLPLTPQNGTVTLDNLSFGFSPALAGLINNAAGRTLITPSTQVLTANMYAVLAANN